MEVCFCAENTTMIEPPLKIFSKMYNVWIGLHRTSSTAPFICFNEQRTSDFTLWASGEPTVQLSWHPMVCLRV